MQIKLIDIDLRIVIHFIYTVFNIIIQTVVLRL